MAGDPTSKSVGELPKPTASVDNAIVVNGASPVSKPEPSGAVTPARPIPVRGHPRTELSPGRAPDGGPMTPRNDAGPFVLDGGAGRSRANGSTESTTTAEDATMLNVAAAS
jgi:hypothetical protein